VIFVAAARSSFLAGPGVVSGRARGRGRRASSEIEAFPSRRGLTQGQALCFSLRPRGGRARAAFTLLEILLAVALIGMITGVFIVGAVSIADTRPPSAGDVFWQAVNGCRKQALMTGREVTLRFAKGEKEEPPALVATWEGGEERYPFGVIKTDNAAGAASAGGGSAGSTSPPATPDANAPPVTCDFLTTQKGNSAILVGGVLMETTTMASVTFYGDGTCTPFRAQLRAGVAEPQVLDIDPWTCAQMLMKEER
jgi:general secretion pathway protein H